MKNKNKILTIILLNIFLFGNAITLSLSNNNPYLKSMLSSLRNKGFVEVSGQSSGAGPDSTVKVERRTANRLPNITGICTLGNVLIFVIKTGPTYSTVSETISTNCNTSPYSLTPTVLIPDGKYKVEVVLDQSPGSD